MTREEVITRLKEIDIRDALQEDYDALYVAIEALEQEPKTGHWILIDKELSRYKCSECGEIIRLNKKNEILSLEKDETLNDYPYSHCGAKMQEVEE
jgi:predicted RNA-binding Zn-ribbon protein involved in translation (DUF1610 family)